MIEEPYRWVEAIRNRREYIDHQLASGSPIIALSCEEGVLLLTLGRDRRKLFEVYDRIGLGGIGHPGDIERLRMLAIETASTEGFTRSADDVSLRKLVNYTMSPTLKNAFEQIYGSPFLARLLLVEVGKAGEADLLLRLDYDGAFQTNGGLFAASTEPFAVIAGTSESATAMERYLREQLKEAPSLPLERARDLALQAWIVGHLTHSEESELPTAKAIDTAREELLEKNTPEMALLDRHSRTAATWRTLESALTSH